MKNSFKNGVPYIVAMVVGTGLVVATAWVGSLMSDQRTVDDPIRRLPAMCSLSVDTKLKVK